MGYSIDQGISQVIPDILNSNTYHPPNANRAVDGTDIGAASSIDDDNDLCFYAKIRIICTAPPPLKRQFPPNTPGLDLWQLGAFCHPSPGAEVTNELLRHGFVYPSLHVGHCDLISPTP